MKKLKDLIYLDFNATTPVDPAVRDVISKTLDNCWGNPSSNSLIGLSAKTAIDNARGQLAFMLQCDPSEIIFTSGGTEASNMIILSALSPSHEYKTPHVITTSVEHDATIKLIEHLQEEGKIEVTKIKVDKNGQLNEDEVIAAVRHNTQLISIMLANNETGIIFPIAGLGRELKRLNSERQKRGLKNIFLHTDAAQAIGKVPVSAPELQVDYITVVGHKFYGPRIGCVYRRSSAPLKNILYGGGQESGWRPGTENTPMIAGLGKAANLVADNLDAYSKKMKDVRDYLEEKLNDKFGTKVKLNFREGPRLPNTASVCFLGVQGVALLKNCKRVVASTGAACHSNLLCPSRVLMECLTREEAEGTLRLSVGRETSYNDIDIAVEDLFQAYSALQ